MISEEIKKANFSIWKLSSYQAGVSLTAVLSDFSSLVILGEENKRQNANTCNPFIRLHPKFTDRQQVIFLINLVRCIRALLRKAQSNGCGFKTTAIILVYGITDIFTQLNKKGKYVPSRKEKLKIAGKFYNKYIWLLSSVVIISPCSTKLEGGILVSPCPSVRPSVCPSARSISYLHSLSSNFRRCVACEVFFKI